MIKKCKQASLVCVKLLLFIALVSSCSYGKKNYNNPPNYDLKKPYIIKLPSELKEISGIVYYRKDNSMFAESDSKGDVYKISLNNPAEIKKWKFGHSKDYEDIVLQNDTFYVLSSNGDIVSLTIVNDSLTPGFYSFTEKGKNEFEALYYDDSLQKLVLICKDCKIDRVDEKTTATAYEFDPAQTSYGVLYTINAKSILDRSAEKESSEKQLRFKPSAAAIHPISKDLYILSSINKLLIVADRAGHIKESYPLDPSIFNQPEGMAFAPNGNLYISNEEGGKSSATILFFQYKNADKK